MRCQAATIKNMMRLSNQFDQLPVLSLHAGQPIGHVTGLLIDPHKLTVAGFWCQTLRATTPSVLLPNAIRDIQGLKGFIIDHEDNLSEPQELVRLREILDINYQLPDKKIITQSKQRLGKVVDFVVDDLSWRITKLHAERPAWKAFVSNAFTIDRDAIVSLDDKHVVVRDATVTATEPLAAPAITPTPAI
jgi:sporulation protein YlmC with PRC-barrel domain